MAEAALYGLVLAGGRSTRMGRDKASLAFGGRTALERAHALLGSRSERVFVSVGESQRDDALRSRFARIEDRHGGIGPIDGILSAQACHSDSAWLVVACDLPGLDALTLDTLVAGRAPDRLATAYRSLHDGLPEPLCAIYEPASRTAFASLAATGQRCPRRMLMSGDVRLLDQPSPGALDNVNCPDDLLRARGRGPKTLEVEYFALFRERAGVGRETVCVEAGTPAELFALLRERHGGLLPLRNMKVAVNDEMAALTTPLEDGDRVLFFPPVSGG